MSSSLLRSPLPWLGALLLAGALVVLGHTSAEAAGDDAALDQPDLLATVVATASSRGDAEPVAAPVTGALRPVAVVKDVIAPPLVHALTGTAVAPLGRTLTDVGAALPAPVGPVGPVARDVADSRPQPPATDETAAPAPQAPPRRAPDAAPIGFPASAAWLAHVLATQDAGQPGATPSTPTSPWSPGQPPSLPAGAPGAGGPASVMAGLGASSLALAAVLTLLLALAINARTGMAAPLALRSAMHASRMRRPG